MKFLLIVNIGDPDLSDTSECLPCNLCTSILGDSISLCPRPKRHGIWGECGILFSLDFLDDTLHDFEGKR